MVAVAVAVAVGVVVAVAVAVGVAVVVGVAVGVVVAVGVGVVVARSGVAVVSALEETLAHQIRATRLPEPRRQFRFAAPERKWTADFAFLEPHWVLVEVDGGTFIQGRHSRGVGTRADFEKLNHAVLAGWRVLRVDTTMVRDGSALTMIERALALPMTRVPTMLGDALFTLSEPEEP